MSCTPMFTVVCWPKRTIFVPARQSQHTSALSAPAETRFLEDNATKYQKCRNTGKIDLKGAHQPECHLDDLLAAAEDER
jgi:hypothetical protein